MHALGLGGKKMLANHNVEDESPVIHIVAGTVAGLVATTLCNPMDVAKTRLQAVDILPSQTSDPTARQTAWKRLFRKPNTISIMVSMVREEGFRALGRGLMPSLLVTVPYGILTIFLYEQAKKWSVKTKDG
jgi:hypothetical protein